MEFYADASSIMVAIYEILIIIFNYINTFYAELSLSKKLFFFKELNNNHLDINKHSKQINALFSLTNQCSNNYKFFNKNEQEKELDYNKSKNTSEINIINSQQNSEINNNIKKKGDDINIIKHNNNHNNIKNKKNKNNNEEDIKDINYNSNDIKIFKAKIRKIPKKTSSKKVLTFFKEDNNIINNNKSKIKNSDNEFSNDVLKLQNYRQNNISSYRRYLNDVLNKNEENIIINNKNNEDIKYDFNFFEIIIASFCKCCLVGNLNKKNNINEKAIKIVDYHLDIISYIRNQMLFDIVYKTILDENIKGIINFLCRPIISVKNDIKNDNYDFYRNYKENDFIEFSEELTNLIEKKEKKVKEKRLIYLSNEHLKDLLVDDS